MATLSRHGEVLLAVRPFRSSPRSAGCSAPSLGVRPTPRRSRTNTECAGAAPARRTRLRASIRGRSARVHVRRLDTARRPPTRIVACRRSQADDLPCDCSIRRRARRLCPSPTTLRRPSRRRPLIVFSHGFNANGPMYETVVLNVGALRLPVRVADFPAVPAAPTPARRLRQPARRRDLRDQLGLKS